MAGAVALAAEGVNTKSFTKRLADLVRPFDLAFGYSKKKNRVAFIVN